MNIPELATPLSAVTAVVVKVPLSANVPLAPLTGAEKSREFKERMEAQGLKQKRIWISEEEVAQAVSLFGGGVQDALASAVRLALKVSKDEDIEFLQEMKDKLINGMQRRDPEMFKYVVKMMDDWMDLLGGTPPKASG